MTTIATDGRSMAGDGLVTCNGTIHGHDAVKVYRITNGIVGATGSIYDIIMFRNWCNAGEKPEQKPPLSDGFEALILRPDGTCWTFNRECVAAPECLPAATGSGASVALGAMDAGASPEQAVVIAAKRNTVTGGTITVLHLEPSA